MTEKIAVVGLACRYPDAASPRELWENALAGRRAFRQLPDERTRLADYWAADPATPDRFYSRMAAVIQGYEFDRLTFRVAGSTYRAADLTHWLALDVAARAFADAGFPDGDGLPRERTTVVVGNTLTGEFTRANVMRLRWPYVRRTVAAALTAHGWTGDQLAGFLADLEASYKSPFPPIDEDTLSGGLSNTIAGRVCNHFDLGGGGYSVDGACSSSLLSVVTAANSLVSGDADVALAGGVDLSLDPFELVGFAKTGALARGEMRVYDRDSNGFWPGEGCGMVVLMREADARRAGRRVYALLSGWGISSDGRGGITRPDALGYQRALRRAYRRAGFGIETVALFEGHGTGTAVGDATELRALSAARRSADPTAPPAAIGSIKAMIGHTKAAAGVAGLIKAALAVHHEVVPPTVGCLDPHPELDGEQPALRVTRTAEEWPAHTEVRAGVTAMGFGGINTHVVLERGAGPRRSLNARARALSSSAQDAELLLLDAASAPELRQRLDTLLGLAPRLAYAELTDVASTLQRDLRDRPHRAALVVRDPAGAARAITAARDALDAGETLLVDPTAGVFLGHPTRPGRAGFLFPGQGSGRGAGGAFRRRFPAVEDVYVRLALAPGDDVVDTAVAQPRIVTGSAAALRVLAELDLDAAVAVGHSLGELTALHWAGAMDEETLWRMAAVRGTTMAKTAEAGVMAGVGAGADVVGRLLTGTPVVIAGYNGPRQTVVAGPPDAVREVFRAATDAGLTCAMLAVSHAFHSPLMAAAAEAFGEWLTDMPFHPVRRRVVSTVTGAPLDPGTDLGALLRRQILEPVRFASAVATAAAEVDLFIEVGPGQVLTRMARDVTDVPAVAVDTDHESLAPLLSVVAAAHVTGVPIALGPLFEGRLARPLPLDAELTFFSNPCEAAPQHAEEAPSAAAAPDAPAAVVADPSTGARDDALGTLRRLAAERAELPADLVHADSRLLDDLHLSSITVAQVVNQAARELGLPAAEAPTNFATATVRELAEALDELGRPGSDSAPPPLVHGVDTWVRPFVVDLDPAPPPEPGPTEEDGVWQVHAPDGHPLAEPLRQALQRGGVGAGVLVCLPDGCPEDALEPALAGVRHAVRQPDGARLVLVHCGRGAAGLAKTAHLEAPALRTTVVRAPLAPDTIARVLAEVRATIGFTEVDYDHAGARRVPVLRPAPLAPAAGPLPLDRGDVLLVTGGGKGITAECARALAADTDARLAILGRSDPATDAALAANLDRLRDACPALTYVRADVTDPAAVRAAVARVEAALGPVTAILHGAGRNEPTALADLDVAALRRTLAPKVDGLRAVLDAVDLDRLRLLVTFGSVIGRAGLRGEAHYALANEWLAELTREVGRTRPHCRAVCLEWSVWSGVGMGERLSVVESLLRTGVTPIGPDAGVEVLRRVLADPQLPPVLVVTGRTGDLDTVRYDRPDLPVLRFLERPLVHYPGVELVTEVDLNPGADHYLPDHRLDRDLLFPAVLGLEAMAQVAGAVTGDQDIPLIERAEFTRPIVVPAEGRTTVRLAALVTSPDTVEVSIRSAETGFGVDHFRATLRRGGGEQPSDAPRPLPGELGWSALDPAIDLYGDTLFQSGRFRRLRRYRRIAARATEAEVTTDQSTGWFSAYLPGQLLLGDPGARDAFMHGLQVCVPDATLLPIGVDRLHCAGPKLAAAGEVTLTAVERAQDGDTYVYDVAVRDRSGQVVESWQGLRLRAVRRRGGAGPWSPALLGPYVERRLDDLLGRGTAVAVEPHQGTRPATAVQLSRLLGRPVRLRHRPDGRPELVGDTTDEPVVSVAHGRTVSLAVAAAGDVSCDLEEVSPRSESAWADLLGGHAALARLVAAETGEPADVAATRVWSAVECLQKVGRPAVGPLTLHRVVDPCWVVLAVGDLRVATLATTLRDTDAPVVVAVLRRREA
ncbi:type I polyketide synthase [Micromonospora sp. NPDC050495]|uniref:type I polyketide synthase n=1 Tax=Micromonospora sp. NPDC050495 TaxID=3154936 RepID=UPI0033F02C0F